MEKVTTVRVAKGNHLEYFIRDRSSKTLDPRRSWSRELGERERKKKKETSLLVCLRVSNSERYRHAIEIRKQTLKFMIPLVEKSLLKIRF